MKIKFIIALVVAFTVIVCSLNFYKINQVTRNRQKLVEKSLTLFNQNEYLERCMKYRLDIDGSKIPFVQDKDIIVYLSGKVCPSCVEKILHFFNDESKLKDRVLVLVDDSSKLNIILTFNDAYQLNYEYLLDSTKILKPINNILVFKRKDEEVKCVLEYRPEEKLIFEKYFSLLK